MLLNFQGDTALVRKKKMMLEAEGIKFNNCSVANRGFVVDFQEMRKLGSCKSFSVVS